MHKVETRLRVRYAETDQMGIVYYANYFVWMEVGRVDYCRDAGFEYRDMEREGGVMLTALRLGNFKLVRTGKENRLELFDLSKDLSEAHDLSTTMPRQTEKLHTLMTNFLDSVHAETGETKKQRGQSRSAKVGLEHRFIIQKSMDPM